MYARLIFGYNTTAGQRNRDIARIIHESNSGTASLSNLEFINTSASNILDASVNSGWSLASGVIPTAGAAISNTDSEYIFQSQCVDNTKIKYVAVKINGNNTTTGIRDSANSCTILQSVLDYSTATEARINGYSGTTEGYSYGKGVSQRFDDTIHIFATPKKLMIMGANQKGSWTEMILEYEETSQSQFYGLVPQVYMGYHTHGASTAWNRSGYASTQNETGSYQYSMIAWPKSLYSPVHSSVVRMLSGILVTNSSSWSNDYLYLENNTTTGLSMGVTGWLDSPAKYSPGNLMASWARYESKTNGNKYGQLVDVNGNISYQLFPLQCTIDYMATGHISFKHCDVFITVADIGQNGDLIIIGNNTYVVFNMSGYSSLIVKKE